MRRAICAVATAVCFALAAQAAAARPILFVGNVDDGSLTVIDAQALQDEEGLWSKAEYRGFEEEAVTVLRRQPGHDVGALAGEASSA